MIGVNRSKAARFPARQSISNFVTLPGSLGPAGVDAGPVSVFIRLDLRRLETLWGAPRWRRYSQSRMRELGAAQLERTPLRRPRKCLSFAAICPWSLRNLHQSRRLSVN